MSDSEDFEDSDADEDLSNRSLEVTKSPSQEDLLPLLECPVCFDLPLPPIRTCYQGHILCADCCPKLSLCPLCHQRIGIGRNFFAEDFLNKSVMKCKYQEDGCLTELPGCQIKRHMEGCQYRPLKCRVCNRKVAFTDIDSHLFREHRISRWDLNEEGTRIILCHKSRTRNPYAAVIDGLRPASEYFATLLVGFVVSFVVDYFYNDNSKSLYDALVGTNSS